MRGLARIPRRHCGRRALAAGSGLAALFLALASPALAQDARVVTCSSTDGRIFELDFSGLTSTVLTDDANRSSMQSCVFRDDGTAGIHLLVGDLNGQLVFYRDITGVGQIVATIDPSPDGLSLDPAQNLYGVTSPQVASSAAEAKVWVLLRDPAGSLAGGFEGPVGTIDSTPEGADELAESVLVTSNLGLLAAGDLLVLASGPAMVLRYRADDLAAFRADLAAGLTPAELVPDVFIHPPGAAVPAAQQFPSGATPNGMDLSQDGSLLVSTAEGVVLHYQADGTRLTGSSGGFVDFASGLGSGEFRLVTGLQDGDVRVFLSDRGRDQVLRFRFEPDGSGTLEATIGALAAPLGIGTTTAALQPTPAGSGVVVTVSSLISSTIENVSVAGATSVREFVFEDPREREPGAPADPLLPLHRELDLNAEISSLLPAGVVIPAHVRAFSKPDPEGGRVDGPPTFILLVASSSAAVVGTIQHVTDEDAILGYSPDCADPEPALRPRLFWRDNPAAGEDPIPEGAFINISNDCGTSRGLTKQYSLFLPARDTRRAGAILAEQLTGLNLVLDASPCIERSTRNALRGRAWAARFFFFLRKDPAKSLQALQAFRAIVEGSPSSFATCTENEGGDLRARVSAAIFTVSNS